MKTLISALTIASMALAASFAMAQGTPGQGPGMGGQGMGPGMGGHGMGPGMDDRASREQMKAAYEACKDKADKRGCMMEQRCAKAPDPAKCQAESKERMQKRAQHMDQRQAAHEACTGKRGEELQKCLHGQREKMHGGDKK